MNLRYKELKIELALEGIIGVESFHLKEGLNRHAFLSMKLLAVEEDTEQIVAMASAEPIVITETERTGGRIIFQGKIETVRLEVEHGLPYLYLEAYSFTKDWERVEKSRSFLDGSKTYIEVAKKVLLDYGNTDIKDEVTSGAVIPEMLLQYEESDWVFLRRLASHFGTYLIPDVSADCGKVYFGVPQINYGKTLNSEDYVILKDMAHYAKVLRPKEILPQEAAQWEIRGREFLWMGEEVLFNQIPVVVTDVDIATEYGELIYRYKLSRRDGMKRDKEKNPRIYGMSIPATVKERSGNRIRVHFDIDPVYEGGAKEKYFTYAIESSSFYCMPEENSRVHIYFPDHDEQSAIAVHAIGSGGGGGGGGKKPDNKRFSDPSGSAMDMTPQDFSFTSDSGGSSVLFISGSGSVTMNGKDINITTQKGMMAGEGGESPTENLMICGGNKVTLSIGDGGADMITLNTEANIVSAFIKQSADLKPAPQPSAESIEAEITADDENNRNAMNDAVKNDLVAKKQSSKQKFIKGLKSIVTVVAVTALVVCTGGAAAVTLPFVLAAGAKTVFAVADMAEGVSGHSQVNALDTSQPANFLRDSVFGGNQALYDLASMGTDIIFDVVSGKALKGAGALKKMEDLFCKSGKVANMVAKTGVQVVSGMIEDYMVTGKINPVNTLTNMAIGMTKGTLGSWLKGNVVSNLGLNSRVAQKIAGTFIGAGIDTGLDISVDSFMGRETNLMQSFSQNLVANGLAEYFGEPIDAVTGGFLIAATDFIISNYRESIRIARKYNSSNQTEGILGKGWVFPYEGRFCKDGNCVHVTLETGHSLIFEWNGETYQNVTAGCGWFVLRSEEEELHLYDRKNHKEYHYDKRGYLLFIKDRNGQAITFDYCNENLEGITTALGYHLNLSYREGRLIQIMDNIGRTIQYRYKDGLLADVVHTSQGVTHYDYDGNGYLIKATDQSGITYLENQYDYKGRVILQTLANGDIYRAEYLEDERKNKVYTSVGDKTVVYTYGKKGQITQMSYADGTATTYEYSEDGGYRTGKISRLGHETRWIYDEAGRKIEEHKTGGLKTSYSYDGENNLIAVYDNSGREWRYEYDGNHNRTEEREKTGDGNGWAKKSFCYDRKGRLISEVDALGNEKLYSYKDGQGSPYLIRQADGEEISREYDSIGRKMAEEDSYGRTEFGYNPGNYRTMVRNPLGHETHWMYDGAGRMQAMYFPKAWREKKGEYSYRYDFLNRLIDTVRPDGSHERQYRDGEGNILKKVHPNAYQQETDDGIGISYDYDADGNQIRIHYPDGGCERFFYDAEGNRIKHVLPEYYQSELDDGEGYRYEYDPTGRLLQVQNPEGYVEAAYTYSLSGNVLTETDALWRTTYYRYDLRGDVTEILRPAREEQGKVFYQRTSFAYDANQNKIREQRFGGCWNLNGELIREGGSSLTLSFSYDERNRLIRVEDGLGAVVCYRYDGRGNRIYEERKISDEVKQVIRCSYFPNGYLKERKEELNSGLEPVPGESKFAVTRFEYDENGNRTKIVTPEGYEIFREYDSCNRLISERSVDRENGIDRTVSISYDVAGNITKAVRQGKDGEPWEIQYDYDLKDRIIHVGDCLGPVFQYEYDKNDRVVKEVLPQAENEQQDMEHAYQYAYNYRGDVLSRRDGSATEQERNTFYSDGRVETKTLADGNVLSFTYDDLGKEKEIASSRSRKAGVAAQTFVYDSRGRITGVINGNQQYVGYDTDSWGRVTRTKNPDGGKEGYTYDYAGNITSTVDANGNTIRYRYNSQGKVCEIVDQNGNADKFYYDREGRLSLYIDRMGTRRKSTYDIDGNLVMEVAVDSSGERRETRSYEYDSIGNLRRSIAGGFVYQYRYRADGKLLEKTSSGRRLISCTYHADGSLKSLTDVTGKTVFYSYDWRGKLQSITDEVGVNIVRYSHSADGRLREIRHFNGIKTSYEYDTDGNITRLATLAENGSILCDLQYEYDLNGNRISKAGSQLMQGEGSLRDVVVRYRYDSMDRLLEEEYDGKAEHYQYDQSGNRLSYQTFDYEESYRYNNRNQLISRSTAEGSVSYTYNLQSNVVEERGEEGTISYGYSLFNHQSYVKTADGQTLESLYDGEGLRAGTIQNGKKSTFLYYNGELLAEERGDETDRLVLGYGVAVSELGHSSGYHAYHLDEKNSTAFITDSAQKIENRYDYDAFGVIRNKTEDIYNRIFYTGQQYDQVTSQYYLRSRFYNPVVGRFLQEDEYRGDGLNLYAYCDNNPVVYYDPSGYNGVCDDQDKTVKDVNESNEDLGGDKKTKKLNEWLADDKELLDEVTEWYNEKPEWWGIDPENTDVYYRTPQEVKEIRKKAGESGGHHPHGLALGGPEGQKLTPTGESVKVKNPIHSQVTGLQRRVINRIKN
ncbi:RHS repeat-associated core domain-containing protein [Lacrimispora sp.]|uniref:RHS repeat-associated core domain-containing protein n=1 Tax=Lacrimispora sp. TaxID=2719234 RepID=UPI002FDA2788